MSRAPRIPLSNENPRAVVECELALANESVPGADGYAMIAPYGDAINVHPAGYEVVQRFARKNAEKLVSAFNERRTVEESVFAGVPIFKKHPKRDGVSLKNDDRTRLGQFDDIQARDNALYGKKRLTTLGNQTATTLRFPTAHWFCEVTGMENGKYVLEPVELEHVGLTDKPNLPVAPLLNEDVRAAFRTTPKENAMDYKTLLISLLAAHGIALANDATDAQIEAAKTEATAKAAGFKDAQAALANEQTLLKAAKDDLAAAQKTAEIANAALQKSDAEKATLSNDLTKAKTDHATATALLDNERQERAKTEKKSGELQTDLVKANAERTALTNELASAKTTLAQSASRLADSETAFCDLAVATGKITSAQRAVLSNELKTDGGFKGASARLSKSKAVLKMVPLMNGLKEGTAESADASKQFVSLVNEIQNQQKCSRDQAWQKAKEDPRGKSLYELMHQPETGIVVTAQ